MIARATFRRGTAMLALALTLAGCMASRTREFVADRAGANGAIDVLLWQERFGAIEFDLKPEASSAPTHEWIDWRGLSLQEEISGVVVVDFANGLAPTERTRAYAPSRAGLGEAEIDALGTGKMRAVFVRVPLRAQRPSTTFEWGWSSTSPGGVYAFEQGVCLSHDCYGFEDVRSVRAVATEAQSEPYPVSRAGVLAAIGDPLGAGRGGRVAIEVRRPAWKSSAAVHMTDVSVLEDARICGSAGEFPLAHMERCYAFADIDGPLKVADRTHSLGDVLVDTATFPFRLVGAAAASAAMGAH